MAVPVAGQARSADTPHAASPSRRASPWPAARSRRRRTAAPVRRPRRRERAASTKRLVRKPIAMIEQQPGDDAFEHALAAAVLDQQQQQRHHSGDHAADQQRQVEQQVAARSRRRPPRPDRWPSRPIRPAASRRAGSGRRIRPTDRLRQRSAGHQAELGRQVLHQAGHHVGQHDHPDQQEAELRARADVGGDIAGVDVGDGRDEGRTEQLPAGPQPEIGLLRRSQLSSALSGLANRKVRLPETPVALAETADQQRKCECRPAEIQFRRQTSQKPRPRPPRLIVMPLPQGKPHG